MRIHPVIPLIVGLAAAACGDTNGPAEEGTLAVSTSTEGDDPDLDGYLLTVGDADTLVLDPSGAREVAVPAGAHRLQLLGVAQQCVVLPGTSLDVTVEADRTTSVGFAISCPATGIRVTTTTTGLDIDPGGYRITVNGVLWTGVPASGTAMVRLEPGERTIALTDVAPNCTIDGPQSHRVTVVDREVVSIRFAAVCTAATGVIGVIVDAEGVDTDGSYLAMVDGASRHIQTDQPTYLADVAPGDHVVTLVPPANCTLQTDPQSVSLTAGGMVRDTAEVSFSVSCVSRVATVRISAITTGTPPGHDYSVYVCEPGFYGCPWYTYLLGTVEPNGTLIAEIPPATYDILLDNVPGACEARGPRAFTIEPGETLDLTYEISCP